jgi:hypothetical protein
MWNVLGHSSKASIRLAAKILPIEPEIPTTAAEDEHADGLAFVVAEVAKAEVELAAAEVSLLELGIVVERAVNPGLAVHVVLAFSAKELMID